MLIQTKASANPYQAIIDRLTWDGIQRRLDNAGRAHSNHTIKVNSTDEVNVFSGIIRCADCGAAMAFNRKVEKSGVVRRFYRCSRYANSGNKSCSMHTIDADTLESIILSDIQYHAQTAITDEKRMLERLLSFSGQERQNEKVAQERILRDATNRIAFIEDASKRLFEEKITGNVPDSLFKKMLADYERELSGLEDKVAEIKRRVQEDASGESDVRTWMGLIKDCVSIDRLDRATAFQLIDNVAVHEQMDKNGRKNQSIQVKYNFVGCLS